MSYLLLTGATGLLGQYLLHDLLAAGAKVACLARDAAGESARDRIDRFLRRFERKQGRALPRPVVLVGDLGTPDLGLSPEQAAWAKRHCRGIVHSAASLEFYAEAATGEPHATNVDGTRNLLAFAEQAGIDEWHQISTAYVCGRRLDVVRESEADSAAGFGNDYEASKFAAEQLVRTAKFLRAPTIYRPSIIVGDSRDDYTSTYQGFYIPVRAACALAAAFGADRLRETPILESMGLSGREKKNFVFVDWVSAVATHLIRTASTHGRTYHLTNPRPVVVSDLNEAIIQAVTAGSAARSSSSPQIAAPPSTDELRPYYDQLQTYRNYFRDEPTFDTALTVAAAPHLPCPSIDRERMTRLARSAMAAGFGWPRPPREVPTFDVERHLSQRLAAAPRRGHGANETSVDLVVTGSGGGEWTIPCAGNIPIAAAPGLSGSATRLHLNTHTFAELAAGRLSCRDAVYAGRLIVEGERLDEAALLEVAAQIVLPGGAEAAESARTNGRETLTARGRRS